MRTALGRTVRTMATGSSPAYTALEPLRLSGTVAKGFGRGSKLLGIPTANLDADDLARQLKGHATGIYLGWAALRVSADAPGDAAPLPVYPAVASIGWNPFFKNKEKTVEPYLMHAFGRDFYGAGIRLVLCGYIRPEADFTSLEALVEQIHDDIDVTRRALELPRFAACRGDAYLQGAPAPTPVPVYCRLPTAST